jgi:hypothetical protein
MHPLNSLLLSRFGPFSQRYTSPQLIATGFSLQHGSCNHGVCSRTHHGHLNTYDCQRNNGCGHTNGHHDHRRRSGCLPHTSFLHHHSAPCSCLQGTICDHHRPPNPLCYNHHRLSVGSDNLFHIPVVWRSRDRCHETSFEVSIDPRRDTSRDIENRIARFKGLRSGDVDVWFLRSLSRIEERLSTCAIEDFYYLLSEGGVLHFLVEERT